MIAAAVYLSAIVLANLSVATFGPIVAPVNAFLLIGLDLTLRDRIHDRIGLGWRMLVLILLGGVLSWIGGAGRIALASSIAFMAAAGSDALTYELLHDRARMVRINGSNVVSAAVDSVVFLGLAFGALDPVLVTALWLAKVAGGFVWSVLLGALPQRQRSA